MNRPRLDFTRLGLATAVAGVLAVILAIGLLRHARSTPDVGPTSATLDEAFSELLGLGLGLLAGSALAPIVVRWGPPFVSGLLAGVTAYAAVVSPYLFLTSDVGPGETLVFVLGFFFLYFAPFLILGALLGWGIDRLWGGRHGATTAPL